MCDINRYDVRSVKPRMLQMIIAQFAHHCQGRVQYAYGKDAVKRAHYVFLAEDTKLLRSGETRVKLCGFLLLQFRGNEAYIDVVCSKDGTGGKLIKAAEMFAHKSGKPVMKLSALPNVINYYNQKHGYRHTNSPCVENPRIRQRGNAIDGYRMTKCLPFHYE